MNEQAIRSQHRAAMKVGVVYHENTITSVASTKLYAIAPRIAVAHAQVTAELDYVREFVAAISPRR